MGQRSPANAAFLPSNSRQPRHRPRALVAFIGGKPQAHEGFGGGAGAAVLFALFAHIAAGFRAAVEEHPGAAGGVVDVALAGGRRRGGGALAFPVE